MFRASAPSISTTSGISLASSRAVSEISDEEAALANVSYNRIRTPVRPADSSERYNTRDADDDFMLMHDLNRQGAIPSAPARGGSVRNTAETGNGPPTSREPAHFVSQPIKLPGVARNAPIKLPGPFKPRYSRWRYLTLFFDGLLALVTIGFIVFAFLVLANDGVPDSPGSLGHSLLATAAYGPTVFPVVFAAIVGRTLRLIATWKLQSGSRFGRIEQLLASNTLFSTFTSHIQLRSFDLIGLIVLVIWLASPLGSQASLRTVYSTSIPLQSNDQVMFLDPQTPYHMGEAASSSSFQTIGRSLFGSALLHASSDPGRGTEDSWGNLRVPMLEAMDNGDSTDWIDIKNASDITYSSLVGIPFELGQPRGSADFTLNVSYTVLDCPMFGIINRTSRQDAFTNFSDHNSGPALSDRRNSWVSAALGLSRNYAPSSSDWRLAQLAATNCSGGCSCTIPDPTRLSEDIHTDNCTKGLWPARRLVWESNTDDMLARADCNLHTTYADVNYTCVGAGQPCVAKSVRRSPSPQNPRNATVFDDDGWANGGGNIQAFIKQFMELHELPGTRYMAPVVAYLMSPDEALTWNSNNYDRNVVQAGRPQFERRLSQLINTLHNIGSALYIIAGVVSVGGEYTPTAKPELYPYNITAMPMTSTTKQRVIRCDRVWLSILLLCCFTALAAALTSVIIRRRILVPDILGSLTLATLDNRCGDIATGGSTLDGIERARLLKHVPVCIADVNPGAPHGRLALSAQIGEDAIGSVKRSRLYE